MSIKIITKSLLIDKYTFIYSRRHDSRSNGLDEPSPDEEPSSKRYRDDNTGPHGGSPNRSLGSVEGAGVNGEVDSVVKTKKTKGRVKISMEYIPNKLRRYTTFSKRKSGIMKKVTII